LVDYIGIFFTFPNTFDRWLYILVFKCKLDINKGRYDLKFSITYQITFTSVWITWYCEKQSSKNWSVLAIAKSVFSDLKNRKCMSST
jgi:hypothetical protein